MSLRFLHASDIHLLDLEGVTLGRWFNKRLTGGANLYLRRGKHHDGRLFDEMITHARDVGVDRIVVTGDLTNLALEPEFALVRDKLANVGMPVTVIPGNHDAYTRGSHRSRRFETYLAQHMQGERASDGAMYPFVQYYGDTALIGVSTAVPTLPLYATGLVGVDQLSRLDAALERTGARGLTRVVLIHHPVVDGVAKNRHQLLDLAAFGAVIRQRGAELVLHGHEHRVLEGALEGPGGLFVPVHGVSSGTSLSEHPDRRASFSIYEVGGGGFTRSRHQWDGGAFRPVP